MIIRDDEDLVKAQSSRLQEIAGGRDLNISPRAGFSDSDRLEVFLPCLKKLTYRSTSIRISDSSVSRFEAPLLEEVGFIAVRNTPNILSLSFPSLRSLEFIGLVLSGNLKLENFEAPALKSAAGLDVTGNVSLKNLSLPGLETVDCSAKFLNNASDFALLSLPVLKTVGEKINDKEVCYNGSTYDTFSLGRVSATDNSSEHEMHLNLGSLESLNGGLLVRHIAACVPSHFPA